MFEKKKNLLSLASGDSPFGDDGTATARRDDDVTFASDGRQSHDAVETEEANTRCVYIAT